LRWHRQVKVNRTCSVLGAVVLLASLWLCSSFLQNVSYIPDPVLIPTIERLIQQPLPTPIFIWRHGINPKPGSIIGRLQRIDVVLAPQALLRPGEVDNDDRLRRDLLKTTRILINGHEFSYLHFTILDTGGLPFCFKPDLLPGDYLIEARIRRPTTHKCTHTNGHIESTMQ